MGATLAFLPVAGFSLSHVEADAGAGGSVARRVGTVQAGDSLWVVAQRTLPGEDTRKSMDRIRRLNQLQAPEAFAGWLRQIVHRMAINRLTRRQMPTSVDHEILEATITCDSDPLAAVLTSEQKIQVHQGLGRLGELDRRTLVAFYLDGQSLNQMSDAFEAPIGTIKRRLHVARKRLAKECEMLQAT